MTQRHTVPGPTTQALFPTTQALFPTTQALFPTTQALSPTTQALSPTPQALFPAALVLCLVAAACTPMRGAVRTEAAPPPAATTYYAGTMQVTSPDGAEAYGPPEPALVKRIVNPAAGTIVEIVLDDDILRTATLARIGDTHDFAVTSDDGSFAGTLTMIGEGWAFTGWTYDILLAEGRGRLEGSATLDEAGIRTEKYFVGPDGARLARIVDTLHPISEEAYERLLEEALAAAEAF
jgi:hypothetical protein